MASPIPGSLEVQARQPLDSKYWIQNFNEIDTGLTFQGLLRFDKSSDRLYIKLTNEWVEIPSLATLDANISVAVGTVQSSPAGSTPTIINSGTPNNVVLDFTIPKGQMGSTPIIDIGTVQDGNQLSVQNVGTTDRAILNFVIPQGKNGKSVWIAYSKYSNGQYATYTLNTSHRFISLLSSVSQPNLNDFNTWVKFVGDDGGPAGESAYQTWLGLGNSGTEQDFLDSLNGTNGQSAYELWLALGNQGTEQEFIDSLKEAIDDSNYAKLDALNTFEQPQQITDGDTTLSISYDYVASESISDQRIFTISRDGVTIQNGTDNIVLVTEKTNSNKTGVFTINNDSNQYVGLVFDNTARLIKSTNNLMHFKVPEPVEDDDAATKAYVDANSGGGSGGSYTLPAADFNTRGGIRIGEGISITDDDVANIDSQIQNSLSPASNILAPSVDAVNLKFAQKADLVTGKVPELQLPIGSSTIKGIVKVGSGLRIDTFDALSITNTVFNAVNIIPSGQNNGIFSDSNSALISIDHNFEVGINNLSTNATLGFYVPYTNSGPVTLTFTDTNSVTRTLNGQSNFSLLAGGFLLIQVMNTRNLRILQYIPNAYSSGGSGNADASILPTGNTSNTYTGLTAPQHFTAFNSPSANNYTADSIQPGRLLSFTNSNSETRGLYPLRSDWIDGVRRPAGVIMGTGSASARTPNVYCQRFGIRHADLGTLDNRGATIVFSIKKVSDNTEVASRTFNQATSGPDVPAGGWSYEEDNTTIFAPTYGLYYMTITKTGMAPFLLSDVYAY